MTQFLLPSPFTPRVVPAPGRVHPEQREPMMRRTLKVNHTTKATQSELSSGHPSVFSVPNRPTPETNPPLVDQNQTDGPCAHIGLRRISQIICEGASAGVKLTQLKHNPNRIIKLADKCSKTVIMDRPIHNRSKQTTYQHQTLQTIPQSTQTHRSNSGTLFKHYTMKNLYLPNKNTFYLATTPHVPDTLTYCPEYTKTHGHGPSPLKFLQVDP